LPLDLMLTQAAGTYRARAMSSEEATNIVVPTLTAGTIVQTSPDIGDTLTVTGSNAPAGATFLWQVDTGGGFGAAGGTNNAATYDTTGRPAGDYRRGVSTAGQSMVYTPAVAVGAAPTGFSFLAEGLTAKSPTATTHDTSVSATSGQRVVFAINYVDAAATISSVVVDPAGSNTAATIRHQTVSGSNGAAIADVAWPSTGSLTVRVTMSASIGGVALTAASVGSKTYQTGTANSSGGASPETHTETLTTTAGDSVIMTATIAYNGAIDYLAGVDSALGTTRFPLAGDRAGYTAKVDSAAGGSPETFTVRWPDRTFTASTAALGVYR